MGEAKGWHLHMTITDVPNTVLAKVGEATRLLVEAKALEDINDVLDMADQLRLLAQQHQAGTEAENAAVELKCRALYKLGQATRTIPQRQGERTELISGAEISERPPPKRVVIAQAGLKPQQVYRAEAVARMPETDFERELRMGKTNPDKPLSEERVVNAAKQQRKEQRAQEKADLEATMGIDHDAEIRRLRLIKAAGDAMRASMGLWNIDPEALSSAYGPGEWTLLDAFIQQMGDWTTRLVAARSDTRARLEVV